MKHKHSLFGVVALTILLGAAVPGIAAEDEEVSFFDKAWGYATLYDDSNNRHVQKIALSGRLQFDSAWFDADQGEFNDMLWRRFRIGAKAELFRNWLLHVEGDFDLNQPLGRSYQRLTDAYIGWGPAGKDFSIKALKQSAGFTLDGATSSKKLLTMQRNNLTNNLWFTREYFTGLLVEGKIDRGFDYKAGVFSSDGADELSGNDAGYFTLLSVGYRIKDTRRLSLGSIRLDHVYNEEDVNAATRDLSHVVSLSTKWEGEGWGFWTDLASGQGYGGQSDLWGVALMPFLDLSPRIQVVSRYTYLNSKDHNGVRLSRYDDRIVADRGDEYNELYAGLNVWLYGHKFKWQTGLQYATARDDADDGGKYQGWGLSTGLRISW